jgi:hypothetical protein
VQPERGDKLAKSLEPGRVLVHTSGLKGVFLEKRTGNYTAIIVKDGQHIRLGTWRSKHDAHLARMDGAVRLHGDFARGGDIELAKLRLRLEERRKVFASRTGVALRTP